MFALNHYALVIQHWYCRTRKAILDKQREEARRREAEVARKLFEMQELEARLHKQEEEQRRQLKELEQEAARERLTKASPVKKNYV